MLTGNRAAGLGPSLRRRHLVTDAVLGTTPEAGHLLLELGKVQGNVASSAVVAEFLGCGHTGDRRADSTATAAVLLLMVTA